MEALEGEEIIWRGHPSWRADLAFLLKWGLIALLPAIIAGVVRGAGHGTGLALYQWILITIVLIVVLLLVDYIRRAATVYTATTRRIHIRRGILSRREQSTHLDRVQNLNTSQSLLGRLLGVGTVDFDTAGTGEREADFSFRGVVDPHELVHKLEPYYGRAIEEAQSRRGTI
jgi:uncharacterized membrane protein YdbT with pleckstrin-like domain